MTIDLARTLIASAIAVLAIWRLRHDPAVMVLIVCMATLFVWGSR